MRAALMLGPVAVLLSMDLGCASPTTADASNESLASANVETGHAPLSPFVPPTPAGCAGATAYDACLAFDEATPLEVRVELPAAARPDAIAVVHFRRDDGSRTLVLDSMKFPVKDGKRELRLYFQVYPGSYRIAVGVDADGDGDPDGPHDLVGWSAVSSDAPVLDETSAALVDVGTSPIQASFALALRR